MERLVIGIKVGGLVENRREGLTLTVESGLVVGERLGHYSYGAGGRR